MWVLPWGTRYRPTSASAGEPGGACPRCTPHFLGTPRLGKAPPAHHPLLLLSLRLRQGQGQLQLLLFLQGRLVPLGGQLRMTGQG